MLRTVISLVASALLAFVLGACSQAPDYAPLPSGSVVLALGDSVTYGTGAARGLDYPARLAEHSGWKVINAGIPGDTAALAKSRIDALLRDKRPALVIVELGGNDLLRRRAEDEVKEDLRAILATVRQAGALAVLVAVPAPSLFNWSLADAGLYRELAKEENVPLVENVLARVLSDPQLRSDPIHPNAQGYRALADWGLLGQAPRANAQAVGNSASSTTRLRPPALAWYRAASARRISVCNDSPRRYRAMPTLTV